MENVIHIKINFGCSIVLKFYSVFEALLQKGLVNTISVSIDRGVLTHYRGEDETFYKNYSLFLKYINEYPNLVVEDVDKPDYPNLNLDDLYNRYQIRPLFKVYPKLVSFPIFLEGPYVTLSTKVLGLPYDLYDSFKMNLFYRLNSLGLKVVLLGERTITECTEYKIHETYSIYNDCVENLRSFEDKTILDNTKNNDLIPLLESCSLLNKSKLNIYMGSGGISELLGFTSDRILGLTNKENVRDLSNYASTNKSTLKVFCTINDFLDNLIVLP